MHWLFYFLFFTRFSSAFKEDFTDNTSVCVYPIGDELFTATETDVIHRIDPDDLSTLGSVRHIFLLFKKEIFQFN